MSTALTAFGRFSSEIAPISMPGICATRVTMSVPISPDPIRPMRIGLPVSPRAARSRASPVSATFVGIAIPPAILRHQNDEHM